ncbi:MAG: NAD(P)-binding protein [Elusimicrobiaceae bacterium]|jgi:voltage-gated potassium channel
MENHYLICGSSQVGLWIVEELAKTNRRFILIESDAQRVEELTRKGLPAIEADATDDSALLKAGIARAAGVFCCLHTDKENAFAAIAAKLLNPDIRIITRQQEESSLMKLRKTGADSAILPDRIGALRMISEMLRPTAVGFLDYMVTDKDSSYRFDDIVAPGRLTVGGVAHNEGVSMIVAVRSAGTGNFEINPPDSREVNAGDTFAVLGTYQETERLRAAVEKMAKNPDHAKPGNWFHLSTGGTTKDAQD